MPPPQQSSPPHPLPWTQTQQINPLPSTDDSWFIKQSHLDSQILTQALQRELSARKDFAFNSLDALPPPPHSLADSLNQFLSSSKTFPTSASTTTSTISSTWLPKSANPSNAGSPLSTSDRLSQPGSPFNSSCANSTSSMLAGDDCKPRGFPTDETQIGAPPNKLEDSGGASASAIFNSWPRSGIERLSAQASVGVGAGKVSKRRSRASTKAPITVLSADTTNFRAMVQKLTGIPASPPMAARNRYHFWDAPSAASILKPQPNRPPQNIHGLPTLDTSAYLLLDGASSLNQNSRLLRNDSLLQGFTGLSPLMQTSQPQGDHLVGDLGLNHSSSSFPSVSTADLKALFPNLVSDPFNKQGNNSMLKLWDLVEGSSSKGGNLNEMGGGMREGFLNGNDSRQASAQSIFGGKIDMEQLDMRQAAALESFLMGNDKADFDSSTRTLHSSVDSWLSPKMELTHSA